MKDYTMSQYATKEDLYADMRKDLEALRRENADLRAKHDRFVRDCGTTCYPCPRCGSGMTSREGCLPCKVADLKAELEIERKNKEEFKRDWLEGCDTIADLKAQRDGLKMAIEDLLCEDHRTCGNLHAQRQGLGDGCLICLASDLKAKVEKDKVYLVVAQWENEGCLMLCAFTDKAEAQAFEESCADYQSSEPDEEFIEWEKGHPAYQYLEHAAEDHLYGVTSFSTFELPCFPTLGASERLMSPSILTANILRNWERPEIEKFAEHLLGDTFLRDKHYRECEEIAEAKAIEHQGHAGGYDSGAYFAASKIAAAIARAREEGK